MTSSLCLRVPDSLDASRTVDLAFKPGELSVCIGMPANRDIPFPTAMSLARTAHACAVRGIPFEIEALPGSSIVTTARSTVAHRFLQGKSSRLFWVDSDIEWDARDFLRLLAFSSEMDVVCAAYPIKSDARTAYVIRHPNVKTFKMHPLGCIGIEGTGLGFTVMTREVVERVSAKKPQVLNQASGETMAELFRIDTADGAIRGEDIAFFEDIRAEGYEVWLDPTINLGHVGQKVYRGDVVKALRLEHVYAKA